MSATLRRLPWLLLAVILVAAALRWVGLDRWPPGLHFDEAVYGLMAKEILAGARPVYFPAYTGREPLYMYVMAAMFAAIGPTAYAIRLTSAFIGVLTVPLTYALGRALYGRRAGLVAAALLAVSYWHITVSRNGYPNILIPPIEAVSVFCLWRGWQSGRRRDWALGGALAGLVLYTYLAARFFPVFLGVLLVYAAVVDFRTWRRRLPGMAIALAAAALVVAPLAFHYWQHPADFLERANQVLAWKRHSGAELLQVYWGNISRTAMAFVVPGQGDPRWHYNLPGRAIFQPVAAAFFLVGLVICLRRLRDLRYAIPVLWIAVLALPGLLTDEMQPAGQRIFGMFPALVLVPALGLVAVGDWVGRWVGRLGDDDERSRAGRQKIARISAALIALVILLDTATTVRDYFFDWVHRPETVEVFNTDYAAIARAAARDIAEGRTPILLSQHYKHPTIVFLAPETADRAVWAEPLLALPVPGPSNMRELVYYRVASYLPDDAPATAWLDARSDGKAPLAELPQAVFRYPIPARQVLLESRHRPGSALLRGNGEITTQISSPGSASSAPRDEPLVVPVDWTVIRPPPAARGFALHLRDAAGTTWAQADSTGYLAEQWRAGDRVKSWFTLDLDRAMPPGEYTADLILLDEKGQPLPWSGNVPEDAQIGAAGSREPAAFHGLAAPVATIHLLPEGARRAPEGTEPIAAFPDGLAILAIDLPEAEIAPGGTFKTGLEWARLGEADGPADLVFTLARDGATAVLPAIPIAAGYPPTAWDEREVLRGRYMLRVPADVQAGEYDLRVARAVSSTVTAGMPDASPLNLGTIRVGGGPRTFEPPPMAQGADATFGGTVKLLGYDLKPAQIAAGAPLTLTLYWQAIETPAVGGKVFVHLFGADGRPVAQHDGEPADGARPLQGWLPGEVVVDRHVIDVPAGVGTADLALGVGIYDPDSGDRWPVSVVEGEVDDRRLRLR